MGDKEEEAGRDDGFVVGFMMVGGSLLFSVASRAETDPRDGGIAVVMSGYNEGRHGSEHICIRVAATAVKCSRE